jgi:hypothetical protein
LSRRSTVPGAASLFLALLLFLLLCRLAAGIDLVDLGFHLVDLVIGQANAFWQQGTTMPTAGMLAAVEQALAVGAVHRRKYGVTAGGLSPSPTDGWVMRP